MFLKNRLLPWQLLLVSILCLHPESSHGQLAQWISPYLPTIPDGIAGLGIGDTSNSAGLIYRQREILNETTGTILEWTVNFNNNTNPSLAASSSTITLNFTTNLNASFNYIALGLSKEGNLEGSDVAIVRNLNTGQAEIIDMYGTDNSTVSMDTRQNWRLDQVIRGENSTSISVIISRDLDTCDGDQDIPINNDLLHVIWGFGNGQGNSTSFQFTPEGSIRAYLADPMRPNVTNTQTWRVSRSFLVPPRHTSYWCTIHKGPTLQQRHHVIGYAPFFSNSTSELHVHHQLVYRCIAPPGLDPALIFDRYLNHPGEECYLEQSHQIPTHLCTEILHTWGVGGKAFTFPEDLGMSIGENQNEYYMFESHYDNPEVRDDLVVENGVDFYYSSNIRPVEGGILFLGAGVLGLTLAPPNSSNFVTGGICSSQCTQEMLTGVGGGGMDIIATILHSHTTTHRMRVQHFRNDQELPWIQNDDNYDFSFQQMRLLQNPRKILPGDEVGVVCVSDTTSRNGTTLSGFSTRDEMCVSFVLVSKRLGYLYCSSEYPTQMTLNRYGIQNVTWDRELQERVVNQANDTGFVGRTLGNVLDSVEMWTDERRRELQNEQFYGQHNSICPPVRKMGMMAYAAYFVEGVTGGLISLRDQIENGRPSTRTVETPAPTVTATQWPRTTNEYRPVSQCVANSK